MSKIAPVLIVAYLREHNVLLLLEECIKFGAKKIYFAVDGAKSSEEKIIQENFIREASSKCMKSKIDFKIWHRNTNLGPAVSVITALDWFFSKESSGIIFEDDLRISSSALEYFTHQLNEYSESNVSLISGMMPWKNLKKECQEFWSNYPLTWGWASWDSKWFEIRSIYDEEKLPDYSNMNLIEQLYWRIGNERCLMGFQDAWDIPMASYLKSEGKICILPFENYVTNVGFDANASNTRENVWPLNLELSSSLNLPVKSIPTFDKQCNLNHLIRKEIYKISTRSLYTFPIRKILTQFKFSHLKNRKSIHERLKLVKIPT